MNHLISILFFLLLFQTSAQSPGVNCELGFNNNYNQYSQGVAVVDEYSYIFHRELVTGTFSTYCYLKKIDTLGNVLWNQNIMSQFYENTDMKEIIPAANGGVYVLGWGTQICDVGGLSDVFITKYDSFGNVEWSKVWNEQNWFDFGIKGLKVIDSGNILVSLTDNTNNPNETKMYTISPSGNLLDSLTVSKPLLDGVDSLVGFAKIGFRQDSLFGFNTAGNTLSDRSFTSNIQHIEVLNDSLYVLTNDSIFIVNSSFQVTANSNISGYSNYKHLKVEPTSVAFSSNSGSSVSIHGLDHNFQSISIDSIVLQVNSGDFLDFGNDHVAVTINHDLTLYEAIRYVDYSLKSPQNAPVNTTDIGIIGLNPTQTEVTYAGSPGAYNIKVWAEVLVKNYGNNQLDDCRINHFISPWGICQPNVYTQHFSNLGLQPGDSIWITLGLLHVEQTYFGMDSIAKEICVYTSHPNYVTDLNVPNDEYCENILFGYIGLDALTPNKKELIRITDLMGRETDDRPNTPLIYIYSDGSAEKIFRLE